MARDDANSVSVTAVPAAEPYSDISRFLPKGAIILKKNNEFVVTIDVARLDVAAIKNERLKQLADNGFYYINANPNELNTPKEKRENFHTDVFRLLKVENFKPADNINEANFYKELARQRPDLTEDFIENHYSQGLLSLIGDFLNCSRTEELNNEPIYLYSATDEGRKATLHAPTEAGTLLSLTYPVDGVRKVAVTGMGPVIDITTKGTVIELQDKLDLQRGAQLQTITIRSPELRSALYAADLVVGNAAIDKATYVYAEKNKTNLADARLPTLTLQRNKQQAETQTKVAKSLALTSLGGFALIVGAAIVGTVLFIAAAPALTIGAIAALPVAATVAVGIGVAVAAVSAVAFLGGVIAAVAYGVKYYLDSKEVSQPKDGDVPVVAAQSTEPLPVSAVLHAKLTEQPHPQQEAAELSITTAAPEQNPEESPVRPESPRKPDRPEVSSPFNKPENTVPFVHQQQRAASTGQVVDSKFQFSFSDPQSLELLSAEEDPLVVEHAYSPNQ